MWRPDLTIINQGSVTSRHPLGYNSEKRERIASLGRKQPRPDIYILSGTPERGPVRGSPSRISRPVAVVQVLPNGHRPKAGRRCAGRDAADHTPMEARFIRG